MHSVALRSHRCMRRARLLSACAARRGKQRPRRCRSVRCTRRGSRSTVSRQRPFHRTSASPGAALLQEVRNLLNLFTCHRTVEHWSTALALSEEREKCGTPEFGCDGRSASCRLARRRTRYARASASRRRWSARMRSRARGLRRIRRCTRCAARAREEGARSFTAKTLELFGCVRVCEGVLSVSKVIY